MRKMNRALHIDFHTMPGIHDFNRDWDAGLFARQLKEAQIDYINAFARCNIGFAYYPTKVGLPYPNMKGDMFGDLLEACHREGIGVSAYVNVGLAHEQGSRRPDWLRLDREGRIIRGDRTANFFRTLCYNNPDYHAYNIAMLKEICDYEIDGLFLDCMVVEPCYCRHCLLKMKALGIDPDDPIANASFQEDCMLAFGEEVKKILGSERYLYLNGLSYSLARHLDTHLEIECLPGSWGYDYFWPAVSYARTLQEHVIYMTGRFQKSWGDFGGLKCKASLEHDYYDALCAGVAISVGDHMHPAKTLEPAVCQMIGEINSWLEPLEKQIAGTRYQADLALLIASRRVINPDQPGSGSLVTESLAGAARLLGELKQSFDVIDETMDFEPYSLLILPDELDGDDQQLADKLSAYLANGGKILASGTAAVKKDESGFLLPAYDFDFAGIESANVSYYRMTQKDDPKLPDLDYNMYCPEGVLFWTKDEVLALSVKSYFNRHWDGIHGYFYTPPERETGYAAAAIRSDRTYGRISFSLFKAYYETAAYPLKALLRQCLELLLPRPLIKTTNLPSTTRVTLTASETHALLHIKVTYPEARGCMNIIEEHNTLPAGAVVFLRGRFNQAMLLPQDKKMKLNWEEDGYTKIELPQITGYQMIRLEE